MKVDMIDQTPKNFVVSSYEYELSAQQFIEGSISYQVLLERLKINEKDLAGAYGNIEKLFEEWNHIYRGADLKVMLLRIIEDHINRTGRFHDKPEKIEPKNVEEIKKELKKRIRKAQEEGNQNAFNSLMMDFTEILEEEIWILNEDNRSNSFRIIGNNFIDL